MYVRSERRFQDKDEFRTVYLRLFGENEAVWLLRSTRSCSLLVSGNLLSCFWRFCCGRHIKVDLSHQPSSNKWIVFFLPHLSLLRSLGPSSIPGIMGSSMKAPFSDFQWMGAHAPGSTRFYFSCCFKLTTGPSRDWHTHTDTQTLSWCKLLPWMKNRTGRGEKKARRTNLFYMDSVWF